MKKYFLIAATLIAALGMIAQPAEAQSKKKTAVVVAPAPVVYPASWWWSSQRDPAVAVATTVVGGAATGAYFAMRDNGGVFANAGSAYAVTSFGCAVVAPIFTTMVVQRQLTRREVWVMTANCAAPIVGGWFVNAVLDANPNPLWDQ